MTLIVALITLFLVAGMIGAIVKRLFRVALVCAVFILLVLGGAIFVIGSMH